jgi:uncharacterized surface protein with fasciclin (FAS1) repeats
MTDLSGNGVSVTLPTGWEGRVFRRPAAGDPPPPSAPAEPAPPPAPSDERADVAPESLRAADAQEPSSTTTTTTTPPPPPPSEPAASEPTAPEGATTNTVVHIATIALPKGVGDFASGAVEQLGANDALIVVFEYDSASIDQPLFATRGLPRRLEPSDFSPNVLQRSIRGQAGAQVFFQDAGRAFCLYVVLGSFQNRARLVPEVNRVLATVAITGPQPPVATNDVVDVIAQEATLSTFSALLVESGVGDLLRNERGVMLLAPHDVAFAADALADLRADPNRRWRTVLNHVVREVPSPDALRARTVLRTMAGGELAVAANDRTVTVDGFALAPQPLYATNGVVYPITGVLEVP